MAKRQTVRQRIDALDALDPTDSKNWPQITKAFNDPSPSLRVNAVDLVKKHSLVALLPEVTNRLKDSAWMVRSQAAVCLGELLPPDGKPQHSLRKLLRDPDWVTRIDAMESLDILRDHGAIKPMAKLLRDPEGIVRSYCAIILAENSGRKHKAELRKLLTEENNPHARVGFLSALFLMGDHALLPKLLASLGDTDYRVRCATVHALENLKLNSIERANVVKNLRKLKRTEPTRAVTSTIQTVLKQISSPA